ncbi:MAG: dTMP kinase [Bacteroidetes bacterium QS_8_68_15]|nr:MAG: dTMP kinase [Bacteroidetes bacterium QS_8_68_15]
MFITFEGIDGSGKTTQVRRLAERLEVEGAPPPLVVRDPGGTELSERVRTLLLADDDALDVTPMAELLLFSAARAQLVEEKIRPALAEGRPVLCDRFYDSTTAYQGAGRVLAEDASAPAHTDEDGDTPRDEPWLDRFHCRVTGGLAPDCTFLLRLSPEDAFRRREEAQRRQNGDDGSGPDRMEAGPAAFHQRVAESYDALAARHSERFCVLDATAPPEALHERIWREVASLRSE